MAVNPAIPEWSVPPAVFSPAEAIEPAVPALAEELEQVEVPKQEEPVAASASSSSSVPSPCRGGCGYYVGQCTRYVALWREALGHPVGSTWGNANTWAINAAKDGVPTGSQPKVGAVMVSTRGEFGHVALVLAVNGDGSIQIREGNYDFNGSVRERVVTDPGNYSYIYH